MLLAMPLKKAKNNERVGELNFGTEIGGQACTLLSYGGKAKSCGGADVAAPPQPRLSPP